MSFVDAAPSPEEIAARLCEASAADVERALDAESLGTEDIIALLSPAAAPYLEALAARSAALTRARFGRTMQLYAPIYLSNECVNRCAYCGFSHELAISRASLSVGDVAREAGVLHRWGFRHLLLVSGEDARFVDVPYLEAAVRALSGSFSSLSVEIAPLDLDGYARLERAGVDGVTLYQETYVPSVYRRVHLAGPKHRYRDRFLAVERAGEAGMRSLGIGALLGLHDVRTEAVLLALHGRYLTRKFWRSRLSVSFPRIRAASGGYAPPCAVSDAELVQMICAMRLALPDAELVLSTRESARLRDQLIGLGITRMSAGSKTQPGGYEVLDGAGEQFEPEDARSPAEVASALAAKGFEPVWKDFDRALMGGCS